MKFLTVMGTLLAICVAFDVLIVMFTVLQIGNGIETSHIAFWDAQIRFITSLMPN